MNRNQESLKSSRGALVRAGTSWEMKGGKPFRKGSAGGTVSSVHAENPTDRTVLLQRPGPAAWARTMPRGSRGNTRRGGLWETWSERQKEDQSLVWLGEKDVRLWEGSEEVLESLRKKDTEVLQGMERCDHKINLKSYFAKEHRFLLGYQLVSTRTVFWQPFAYRNHKPVEIGQLTNTIWVSAEKQDRAGRTGFTQRSQFTRFSACNR